ncbi:MAG: hypothetical protein K1X79_12490 [Oligoflexia bacterium]|nr:hypothetical protein [Oligoflexia bacterium]
MRTGPTLTTLLIALLTGCSQQIHGHHHLVERLNNRGMVGVSANNPYIAANLLLTREMELSSDLKGFIEHRGLPGALEVKRETFGPLFLHFYYPKEKQSYSLEDIGDQSWLIKGPFPLSGVLSAQANALSYGQDSAAGFSSPSVAAASPSISPTAAVATSGESEVALVERLSKASSALAEISPRGDIVHYVTSPKETLSIIARWYTGEVDNAGRLASINKLSASTLPDKALSAGDTIIIPSYMAKNKHRLDEKAIDALSARAGQPN